MVVSKVHLFVKAEFVYWKAGMESFRSSHMSFRAEWSMWVNDAILCFISWEQPVGTTSLLQKWLETVFITMSEFPHLSQVFYTHVEKCEKGKKKPSQTHQFPRGIVGKYISVLKSSVGLVSDNFCDPHTVTWIQNLAGWWSCIRDIPWYLCGNLPVLAKPSSIYKWLALWLTAMKALLLPARQEQLSEQGFSPSLTAASPVTSVSEHGHWDWTSLAVSMLLQRGNNNQLWICWVRGLVGESWAGWPG